MKKQTKNKILIFVLIVILAIILCGVYLIPHKITDTYWNIGEDFSGYKTTPLKDGRIIHFAILSIMQVTNLKIIHLTAKEL